MILELDRNLAHYADVIKRTLRVDVKRSPAPVRQAAWARR
jgi:glycerate kinase